MKKKLTIAAVALVLIGAGLFFYFHPKKAIRIVVPEFENVEQLRVLVLEDTALLNASIKFQNKSIFRMTVDSFIYKMTLDTFTVVSKRQALHVSMRPSQVDTILLPLAVPFKSLMAEMKEARKKDSIDLHFDLEVRYATWLGEATLPYKKTVRIAVPVPPKLEVLKLDYRSRHKKTFFFDAHIKVLNRGNLKLHLSDLSYKLNVEDNFSAAGRDPRTIDIKPKSEEVVVLPIQLEFDHLFKTLVNIATDRDKVNYHLEVHALGRIADQEQETELSIEKNGITELKK